MRIATSWLPAALSLCALSACGDESKPATVDASLDAYVPAGYPGPANTGVPPGTQLSEYTGPCTISADDTVIDSQHVTCDVVIHAARVVIKKSKIEGLVHLDADLPGADQWSATLEDSEVDGGMMQRAAVSDGNITIMRSNIHGGQTAVHCSENAISCTVKDSWLHGQYLPPDQPWHLGGFQSNGGTNIVLQHNNIVCDAPMNALEEGCTGDIVLLPDFAVVTGVLVEGNYLGNNLDAAYCTYGGDKSTSTWPKADHVLYKDNVFARGSNGKCAAYGPVTGFDVTSPGNQWINNTWEDDHSPVMPED